MDVVPGHRVTVPFGRRSTYGFVVSVGTEDPGVETKPIATAGSEPLLLPHQVELARLVADHYWLPLIECIRAMLPPRVRGTGSAGSGASSRQRRHTRLLELATGPLAPAAPVTLTAEQRAGIDVIGANPVTLLHGVIASGKTEVYLAAAERALAEGLRVLLLVPEISLTPQLVQRVRARLNAPVALLQSQLTELEMARRTQRVRGRNAEVELVDMRDEAAEGNRQPLSRQLVEAVTQTLDSEEQTILYLNRRGLATYVMCRDCGKSVQCLGCSVALVQHSEIDGLVCHYCGYARQMPAVCDHCGSRNIRALGMGTQRLEGMVKKLWPQARVLRLDSDAARGPDSYFRIWEEFSERRADILVGTQLVTRGLDLPAVTCVGVVDADLPLHFPDYRSAENTFSLVAQVAGRAGRDGRASRVIVQTSNPEHYSLRCAASGDYEGFYNAELPARKAFVFPPYAELAVLTRTDREDARAAESSREAAEALAAGLLKEGIDGIRVMGPSPAFIHRLRGEYRWQLTLKGDGLERARHLAPRGKGWSYDIDPAT